MPFGVELILAPLVAVERDGLFGDEFEFDLTVLLRQRGVEVLRRE